MGMSSGSGILFSIIPIIILISFIAMFGLIIAIAIRVGIQWNKNNKSPILTVTAKVLTKRTSVDSHHHHQNDDGGMFNSYSSTTYYTTFEVESGDRMEFCVLGTEYGMLVEGDIGMLTFQGTRFKGFKKRLSN